MPRRGVTSMSSENLNMGLFHPSKRRRAIRATTTVESLERRQLLSFSIDSATLLGPQFTPGTKWTYKGSVPNGDEYTNVTTVVGPDTFQGQNVTRIDSVDTYTAG